MHSEGILAGELKHGPLALVDNLMPVIMIIMRDHTYIKCQNALQQVVARQVRPIHTPQMINRSFDYLSKKWATVKDFLASVFEHNVVALSDAADVYLLCKMLRKPSVPHIKNSFLKLSRETTLTSWNWLS